MKYIILGFLIIGLLIGMAAAVEGFQHKDFRNAEGARIIYDIDKDGYFTNGYFHGGDLNFRFSGSMGTVTTYAADEGQKGIMQVKPYDGTVFDVELRDLKEPEVVFASYRFDGNFCYTGSS
jgi:hypothetical protein